MRRWRRCLGASIVLLGGLLVVLDALVTLPEQGPIRSALSGGAVAALATAGHLARAVVLSLLAAHL